MQCVAIDPTEERIAAGDVSGRILIWNSFKDKVPQLQKPQPQPSAASAAAPLTAAASASTAVPDAVMQPAATADKDSQSDSDSDSDESDSSEQQDEAAEQQQATQSASAANKTASEQGTNAVQAKQAQSASVPSRTDAQHKESMQVRLGRMQNSLQQVPLTTVHWHAHPVGSVCFSADGTLLLSGGEEAVLVGAVPKDAHTSL